MIETQARYVEFSNAYLFKALLDAVDWLRASDGREPEHQNSFHVLSLYTEYDADDGWIIKIVCGK